MQQAFQTIGQRGCSFGGTGRTSEGNRHLVVLATHKMGYKTNFDEKGDPPEAVLWADRNGFGP